MAQYVCNPIVVDAFQIVSVGDLKSDGSRDVALDNGENYVIEPGKMSRMTPVEGDYLVRTHQPDEYEYLNPKHVFEAKYTKLGEVKKQEHGVDKIDIGDFTITEGYGSDEVIWITRGKDGEGDGGNFDKAAFNAHVRTFFDERF